MARTVVSGGNVTRTGILTMVLILAFVWGGFLLILSTAARKESSKDVE